MPRAKKSAAASAENINPALLPLARELDTLRLDEENAREHDDPGIRALADSLSTFGQQKPIVASSDGKVIAGNGTLQAARLLGWKRLAVVVSNLDERGDKAFALADNRTAELSGWGYERLSKSLQEIAAWEDGVISKLGWDDVTLKPLLAAEWTPPPASTDEIEIKRRGEKGKTEGASGAEAKPRAPVGGMECVFTAAQWAEVEQAIERFVKAHPEKTGIESFEEAIVEMCRSIP